MFFKIINRTTVWFFAFGAQSQRLCVLYMFGIFASLVISAIVVVTVVAVVAIAQVASIVVAVILLKAPTIYMKPY